MSCAGMYEREQASNDMTTENVRLSPWINFAKVAMTSQFDVKEVNNIIITNLLSAGCK